MYDVCSYTLNAAVGSLARTKTILQLYNKNNNKKKE